MFPLFGLPEKIRSFSLKSKEHEKQYKKDLDKIEDRLDKVKMCCVEPDFYETDKQLEANNFIFGLIKIFIEKMREEFEFDYEGGSYDVVELINKKLNKPCNVKNLCYESGYTLGFNHGYTQGKEKSYNDGIRDSNEFHFNIIKSDDYDISDMINDISILLNHIKDKKIYELPDEQKIIVEKYFNKIAKRFKIKKDGNQ